MKKLTIFSSLVMVLLFSIELPLFAQSELPYTQGTTTGQLSSISESGTHLINAEEEPQTIHLQLQNFDFNFNETVYNDFYINPMGWVSLGADATGEVTSSNDLTSLSEPLLTPLWDQFNLVAANGSTYFVYYEIITVNSEQVLVIEWHDMEWMDYAANFSPGAKVNFQMRLYETSKKIEFVYQSPDAIVFTYDPTGGVYPQNTGASIGISDASFSPKTYMDENFTTESVEQNSYDHFNDKVIYFDYVTNSTGGDTVVITTTQSGISVYPDDQDKVVLQLTMDVPSVVESNTLNQLKFSLNGTNSLFDIQNAKIYYSVTNNILEAELKNTIPSISTDSLIFDFSNFELSTGVHYVWLSVDINQNAIEGNLIDANLAAVKFGDIYRSLYQSPNGSLLILNNTSVAGRGITPSGTINTADYSRNWTEQTTYNADGSILSVSRTYFDNLGRTIQQQNNTGGTIIANQVVYDMYGRAAIQTLPAVRANETSIVYDNNFITNGNSDEFSYADFDLYNKRTTPNSIKSTNTLASYYNNSNTMEPYVATTSYPYSRVDYVGDATSRVQTQTLAGEDFKLGTNRQIFSFDMLSAGELSYVYGAFRSYVQDNLRVDVLNSSSELAKANKVVTIDVDKKVSVAFYGPNNILVAKCLSGIESNGCVSQKVAQTLIFNPIDKNRYSNSIDIHLPKAKSTTLKFTIGDHNLLNYSNLVFELYDLLNKKKLIYGTDYSISNTLGIYSIQFLVSQYQSQDKFLRFSVNLGQSSINWNSFKKVNKLDCFIYVNYELDYSNWTANYFDSKLNLISSIQPKDLDCTYNPLSGLNNIKGAALMQASSTLNTQLAEISVPDVTISDRQIKLALKPVLDFNNTSVYVSRTNPIQIETVNITEAKEVSEIFDKNEIGDISNISADCAKEIRPKIFYKKRLQLYFNVYGTVGTPNAVTELIAKPTIWLTLTGYTVEDCNIARYSMNIDYKKSFGFDNDELKNYEDITVLSDVIYIYDEFNDKDKNNIEYSLFDINNDAHKYIFDPLSNYTTLFNIVKLKLDYEIYTYPHSSLLNYSDVYKNKYDVKSRLVESTSQDEGKTKAVYNIDNQIRFTQNELQQATGKFSYINYDQSGRVIETGEYDPTIFDDNGSLYYFFETEEEYTGTTYSNKISAVAIANAVGSFNTVRCTNRSYIGYDVPTNDVPTTIGTGYTPKYLEGRMAKSWNDENITWYGYGYDGKLAWVVQGQSELGTKTIDYTYDYWGNVLTTEYQKGSTTEKLKHIYTYDNYLRLADVSTLRGSENTPKLQARYIYYKHGPLKRKEIGDKIQGVDYVYTINGWLKSINEPSLTSRDPGKDGYTGANSTFMKDVFGMSIDYFNNDYIRAGSLIQNQLTAESAVDNYDGKIKAVNWKTQTPTNSGNQFGTDMLSFIYNYDTQGQLSSATFGTNTVTTTTLNTSTLYVADSFNELPQYKVFNISYDKNGNIKTLNRNGDVNIASYLKDQLTYNYATTPGNKLISVTDQAADADGIGFVPPNTSSSTQYEYDDAGRMVTDYTKNISITYNLLGKVSEIHELGTNNLKIKYAYNERGYKIRKTVYPDNENTFLINITHYLNDVSGNVVSVYIDSRLESVGPKVNLEEQTIAGMGRVGVIYVQTSQTVYEITDHLGNVRATISDSKEGTTAEVLSYTDYYPHGSVMPGRNYTSSTMYRYDYQGIEKDQETNWNNFELRMYDANLGRWMSPDPYGEFFSPYLAMGNNPVSTVDPDGGKTVQSGVGANYSEVEYTGRTRPVDPFDMVGGGGSSTYYKDGMQVESWENPSSSAGSGVTIGKGNVSFTSYSYKTKDGWVFSWSHKAIWNYYNKSESHGFSTAFPSMGGESNGFNGTTYISGHDEAIVSGKSMQGQSGSGATGINVEGLATANGAFATAVGYGEAFSLSGQGQYITSKGFIRDINPAKLTANSKPYANAGKVLKSLGRVAFFLSVGIDAYAYRNNQISGGKFGLNTSVNVLGLGAGAAGMAIPGFMGGAMYYGVEVFYPGGWSGAMNNQSSLNQANKAINPSWQLWPGAMKQ